MTIGFRRASLWFALALVGVGACSGGAERKNPDAAPTVDASRDRPTTPDTPSGNDGGETGIPLKPNGATCYTGPDCVSGFCVDGVCCNTACNQACYTCVATSVVGTCIPADVGTKDPRGLCTDKGRMSCGQTGVCDGAGACEFYAAGTVCQDPGCSTSMLTTAGRCDGAGTCAGGSSTSCAPFQCSANGQCRTTCMTDADCVAPNTCVNGSCGKKPIGGICGVDSECNSGFCAQGVCCQTACTGTCKSCALAASAGTCTSVPAGMDPLMQCNDAGAMTCGLDGACDGAGACRRYASGTVCGADSCSAGTGTVAGRCNGTGTCQDGTPVSCSPYVCGAMACLTRCATNADCATGFICNGTICGKKPNGATCSAGSDCTSTQCYQGVCCNVACGGTCVACNLVNTVGTCTPIPAGTAPNPATQCVAAAATTCGNDGMCDGAGACRKFAAGTNCAAASCTGSTLTSARTCDGMGACRPASVSMCDPFTCGANAACRVDCSSNAQCVSPNSCMMMSCGKKPPGAACTTQGECNSGFCAQGVCCSTACTGTCKSCALAGSAGACSNVPSGTVPTPATQCADAGASTCGNDGTCDGNGACRKYVTGTQCAALTCSGSTFTPPRLCNGTGTCAAATSSMCNPYVCNATTSVCRTACTVDADCITNYFCISGSCSKKPLGGTCAAGSECNSGFCAQGVCCASACTGTCQSCALTASPGTCSPIPVGQAPSVATQCADAGASTCGTNGLCNGTGGCQLYANGTICLAGSCTGSTLTPPRTCDGTGVCKTVTTSLCDPYGCDTTAKVCKTTCSAASDCASPNTCVSGSCGSKPLGSTCASGSECNSGICAQSTCCSTSCAGNCVTCANASGTCSAAAAGTDPLNQCTMVAQSTCGLDGMCDGSGACRRYASGSQCAAATCTGSTLTPAATCNGTGTCNTPATSSCTPYNCGTGACKTACTTNADCINTNFICTGGKCTPAVNLQVRLKASAVGASQWVAPQVQIYNNSPAGQPAIPLAELTVRYWYTNEGGVAAGSINCNYATRDCMNISYSAASIVVVNPARTKADRYFQFGFTTAAGTLAVGGDSGEVMMAWARYDWSNFDQSNDYSYNAATAYTPTTLVTVYRNGTLVYGTEP